MSRRRAAFGLAAVLAAACAFQAGPAFADGIAVSEPDARDYTVAPHFKALAASQSGAGGAPIVRYSFNYDTPAEALRAALAYCEEARRRTGEPGRWAACRPVRLGPYPVEALDESGIEAALERYLAASIATLADKLALTDDRAALTSLETVLHKSGRYAESEALLRDLAASGEPLARNALAYHWAERNINLDRALAYADSAIAAQPETASFHDTRALVLYRLGRIDAAVAEAERAAALGSHPIILDHEGDLYWAAGRCAEAARAWRQAIAGSADILFRQRVAPKLIAGPDGPPVFD